MKIYIMLLPSKPKYYNHVRNLNVSLPPLQHHAQYILEDKQCIRFPVVVYDGTAGRHRCLILHIHVEPSWRPCYLFN